jgi:hypothetical protein
LKREKKWQNGSQLLWIDSKQAKGANAVSFPQLRETAQTVKA